MIKIFLTIVLAIFRPHDFDSTKIKIAHQWNKDRVDKAMQDEKTPLCVSNTNIMHWEYAPYISLAKAHGYSVQIMYPQSPWFREIPRPRKCGEGFAASPEPAAGSQLQRGRHPGVVGL